MSQKTAGEIGEDKKQEIGANIKTTRCVKTKQKWVYIREYSSQHKFRVDRNQDDDDVSCY